MRELGGLRDEARALDPALTATNAMAEVDAIIARAAQAVDETISGPESEVLLRQACEAIVIARARVTSLLETARGVQRQVERSRELRREASRLLAQILERRSVGD